jgi:Bacteriophage HK97-gp10, putative tail-component
MDVEIDTAPIEAFAKRLQGAEPLVRQELGLAMQRSVLALENRAKGLAPVKTGTLRRSITSEVRSAGGSITGIVGTNVPYARYVEEGRGPVVARGRALRFTVGGQTLFRKRVGPAKANPFFKTAVAQSAAAIAREFGLVIPRVARRLGW